MKARLVCGNLEIGLSDDNRLILRSHTLPVSIEGICAKASLGSDEEAGAVVFDRFAVKNSSDGLLSLSGESEGLRVELVFRTFDGGLLLQSKLTNLKGSSVTLRELCPLFTDENVGKIGIGTSDPFELVFFKNGWQSWSASFPVKVGQPVYSPHTNLLRITQEDATRPCAGRAGEHSSDMVTFIHDPASKATLVIGFADTDNYFSEIALKANPSKITEVHAKLFADGMTITPNAELELDALWIALFETDELALEGWADVCSKRMKARVPEWNPKGWCSWYYYFIRINETVIRNNLEILGRVRERLGIEVFLIDDGYERVVGDWLELKRGFSSSLDDIAREIRAEGLIPGIWLAPFIASSRSRTYKENPDWFLKNERDKPVYAGMNPLWRSNFYALDPTHPQVKSYVERVLTRMLDAGFEFFKFDFLYAAALDGVAHLDNLTRAQRLRRGLEFIRQIAGDKFMLGCGCPLGPAVGIFDAMRIGPDVAPFWGTDPLRRILRDQHALSARSAIRNSLHRLFMHRRLWLNDTDCILVRKNRTRLNIDEVKSLCANAMACGGATFFSDAYERLDGERISLLQRTLTNTFSTARLSSPASLDRCPVVVGKIGEKCAVVVLNTSDEPRFVSLKFDELKISAPALKELFSQETVQAFGQVVEIPEVPPHGALALVEENDK